MKRLDLTNKKYGYLTCISCEGTDSKGRLLWKAECDCGAEIIKRGRDIVSGNTKSCGCKKRHTANNHHKWNGYELISGTFWKNLRQHAKARQIEVNISLADAWEQWLEQEEKCALSGRKLNFNSSSSKYDGNASLDRIDSSLAYDKNNIQWISKEFQWMKNNFDQKEFIALCKEVAANFS